MNRFEEFEREMAPAVQEILPGAKCGRFVVTFVDDDGATCNIGLTREGFESLDDTDGPTDD